MLSPALAALLLLSPQIEGGFHVAGGRIATDPVLELTPWFGLEIDFFAMSLQAPIRFDLSDGHIRERDWDESEDFARTITTFDIGEAFHAGTLHVTFGEGTLVHRFCNNLDTDHAYLGTALHLGPEQWAAPVSIDLFSSRLLGKPVVGAQAGLLGDPVALRVQLAADFNAPTELQGWADDQGRLAARYEAIYALGGELSAQIGPVTLYGAGHFQGQGDDLRPGAHVGTHLVLGRKLQFESRVEGFLFDGRYDPALFDATYLLDAWMRRLDRPDQGMAAGGLLAFGLNYNDHIQFEARYSDASRDQSASLSGILQVTSDQASFQAFYSRRYAERSALLDGDYALWAVSMALPLGDNFQIRAVVAQSPAVRLEPAPHPVALGAPPTAATAATAATATRITADIPNSARYVLYTDLLLRLEAQF